MRYLTHPEVIRLVEAQPEPFRTISALMHATGMEISAVLRATRADLDTNTWMIRAHGTKTSSRDRQAYIKTWARPYLLAHISRCSPVRSYFRASRGGHPRGARESMRGNRNFRLHPPGLATHLRGRISQGRYTCAIDRQPIGARRHPDGEQGVHAVPAVVRGNGAHFRALGAARRAGGLRCPGAMVHWVVQWPPMKTPPRAVTAPSRWICWLSRIAGAGLEPATPAL